MQEYSYGHTSTKAKINAIFNSHFYGSVLWNLFGNEVNMTYNTWHKSIRKMFRLDRGSHRYLIEPVSKTQHIKTAFLKRFTMFCRNCNQPKAYSTSLRTIVGAQPV